MREGNVKQKDRSHQQGALRRGRRSTIFAVVVVMHLPTFFAAAHGQTNSAPVVQMSIEDSTLTVGYPAARYDLSNHFSDPDGDSLSYGVAHSTIVGVLFSGSTMSLTGKAAGTTTVRVQATDPSLLSAELTFEATVRANTAPVVLLPIPDATLTVGGRIGTAVLSAHFQDPEEGDLTYAVTSADPAIATATVAEGVLSVTAVAAGATTVTVSASDPAAAPSAPDVLAVTVGSPVSITIPDANLRTAVEAELGKEAGATINSAEMEGLGRLECDSCGIQNLTGLEFATGLAALALGGNSITDPTPLSGLTGLTDLDLGSNSLTDVSPLSDLTGLTDLDLGSNSLTDVSPLSGLTGLTDLDLGSNSLTDVTPLSGLTGLTGLDLGSNSLTDVSPLSGLTGLTDLELGGNSLTDVSPLSGLTGLTGLDLGGNSLTDASPLSGLVALTDVDLDGNSLTDLSPLSSLTGLSRLYLRHNCLTGVHALTSNAGLGQGDHISLEWNPLLASAVAGDLAALRGRGVTVLVSETASVEVGAPVNVSATPDDGELTLTWDSPRAPDDVTVYEVRWRSAAGTFNAWTIVPCSSERRHKLTGLDNGTAYTVELRAAGHADNGVASTGPTTVNPPNRAPIVLLPIPDVTLTVGSGAAEVDLSNYFSDPDGDQLLFTATPPTIVTATVSGNTMGVSPVAAGTGVVTVRAADPPGLFVEQTFNVTVNANSAPEVSLPIDHMTLTVGGRPGTVTLSAHFRDPEERALTYSVVSANPAVATVALADGVLTVSALAAGTTRVTVTASDLGGATSAPAVFTVTARAPVNVEIPDACLRAAVELALGKQPGTTINSAEMERVGRLECYGYDVDNLAGLEFATALTWLDLRDNSIADLTPLSGLPALTDLYLSENPISDLTPLSGLTRLTRLYLDGIKATDLAPLSGLAGLSVLHFHNHAITDVSPLSGLTSLTTLNLGSSGIASATPLSGLTNLTTLSLAGTAISDLAPLSSLTNLTTLVLRTGARDLTPLSNLTNLATLMLDNNAITSLAGLSRLTNLRGLYLRSNAITDLTLLSGLTNLTELYLGNNAISDARPLSSLTSLTELSLSNNAVTNLTPLSGLTNLRTLSLGRNEITDVSPLTGLTNLTGLSLSENAITNLAPLVGLTNLTRVGLSSNAIADLTGLSDLTNLTQLSLWNNAITDLTPLSGVTNLTRLWVSNNEITNVSPLSGLTNLAGLYLSNNEITDLRPFTGLTNLRELWLARNCVTSLQALNSNTGLGAGDTVYVVGNALDANTLANDVTALRQRGVTVRISEAPTARVGPPWLLIATPGDRQLTLTWQAPGGVDDIPVYEVRWRSATGAFGDWTAIPCSSKLRHELTGLMNGTTYTVELRAAGHADNRVANVSATPSSDSVSAPVGTTLQAALTAPGTVPRVTLGYGGTEIRAEGAWALRLEDGTIRQPQLYLRVLHAIEDPPSDTQQVRITLSTSATGSASPPQGTFGGPTALAIHDAGLEEALVDANGSPLVTAVLTSLGNGRFGGTLAGDTETFWDAFEERGPYSESEGLYVELTP